MSRTALLLGGRGFIGTALTAALIERDHRIVVAEPTATTLGRLTPYADHVELVKGDVSDPDALTQLVSEVDPTCVVNLAFVRGLEIAAEMEVMGRGVWNTLAAAQAAGCRRVVLASSVRVYGPQQVHGNDAMLNEDSACKPVLRYGATKLLAEQLAADYTRHGLEAVALRIPMVYGPGVREGAFGVCVPAVAAGSGRPGSLPYDPHARLCLAHIDDVAHALAGFADVGQEAPRHSLYELGGHTVSYADMVQVARDLVPTTDITFVETQKHPEHSFAYRLDGGRLAAEYGFTHRSLHDGYRSIVEYEQARADSAVR